MAIVEIKVPSPGESISEVRIARWNVKDGDVVNKDQVLGEIDSDKATLEVIAEEAGKVKLLAEADAEVKVGDVVVTIDTSVKPEPKAPGSGPRAADTHASKPEARSPQPAAIAPQASSASATPVAKAMLEEKGLSAENVKGSGPNGRITKSDVAAYVAGGVKADAIALNGWGGTRNESRQKMTTLRKKVAERLVSVKNQTAMLTTFNEVDMSAVMALRDRYKDRFKEAHGVNLGFMSFFTKAVTEALRLFPAVNGQINGDEIVTFDYADIGIAVSSPKGLMVPVLRNAEKMSLAEIEAGIKALAVKARDGKLSIDEMTGGTFTITNGGVFGSMLSTPIINPPQSAILGMHNIVERPVAVNGQVVIRPIMYVALSYDHRIIDGKESVSFLMAVKQMIENPDKMVFGNKEPGEVLLGL
ncbi:MAG: 2-oxoglutarate dehydrogenase complex dihydrolipoyllysine-residue succinyltransferase [Flavobacteriales bacterium]|nr:MAG: 2-oxoglutarate dehydrogenase complex dihydrolipoyllysine-residue succinyltransferase [Flavobacteriales bacterium]